MFRIIYGITNAKNTTKIVSVNLDGDIWCGFAVLECLMDISIPVEKEIYSFYLAFVAAFEFNSIRLN